LIFTELEEFVMEILLVVVCQISNVLLILIIAIVVLSISLGKTACIWYLNYFFHLGFELSESVIGVSFSKTKEVVIYFLIRDLVDVLY
jgi:hypothetical protein